MAKTLQQTVKEITGMSRQSREAESLCHKIIALHKRLIDAGVIRGRLDVVGIQRSGKKHLTGVYSRLLELGRGA